MAIVVFQAKSMQKQYFLVSKPIFKKFFLGYFYPPTPPMEKNQDKMVPKLHVHSRGLNLCRVNSNVTYVCDFLDDDDDV